ncbi:MAG: PPC domain-containing protein [Opitutales bacterium]|nr:PPC domain-containing protein [Opitutales bacterium]
MSKISPFIYFILLTTASFTFGSEPIIDSLLPRGGQKGTDQIILIKGKRLADTTRFLFYKPGLSVTDIQQTNGKEVGVTFKIAPNAPLGQHEVRLCTDKGISNLVTFWVGPFENLKEVEPNSSFATAQPIPLNFTVNGICLNEDVDFFEINATKGERISAEIEAIRLSGPLFDPFLAILNDKRFEIATNDDSELLLQDSTLSILAPYDGVYRIEVRDSSYKGGKAFHYRLHVGTFPRPLVAFPAGSQSGVAREFKFLGDPTGDFVKNITIPSTSDSLFAYHHQENDLFSPSPNLLRITHYPSVEEREPNNLMKEATITKLTLPLAFDGVIEEEGDMDYFRFSAKKGDRFYIRAHARSIASPLDPVLNLYHENGKSIRGNDDADKGPDSLITQTFPKDGEYILRIRDHLGRGSPRHVYRIETDRITAKISGLIPKFGNRDSQSRQMIPVPQGGKVATVLSLNRKNFSGAIELIAGNLPPKVFMTAPHTPNNLNTVTLLFEASPDAPKSATLSNVRLIHKNENKEKEISGEFNHQVELVYGPPNNQCYYDSSFHRLPVAVVDPVPFAVKLHPPKTPIVQGGSMNLKVEIFRDANFTEDITVKILARPTGLGARSSIKIKGTQSSGFYPLTANGNAETGRWKIAVQGEAKGQGGGSLLAASDFIELDIEEPYVQGKLNMSAIQKGNKGTVTCILSILRPFSGKGQIELKGLPPLTTCPPLSFDGNTSLVSFPIEVSEKAQPGITKNLFCFAKIPFQNSMIVQTVGQGGQIRIDHPPPKAKTTSRTPIKESTSQTKTKAISRLEQLRAKATSPAN